MVRLLRIALQLELRLAARLTGLITRPWLWWILAPLWLLFAVTIVLLTGFAADLWVRRTQAARAQPGEVSMNRRALIDLVFSSGCSGATMVFATLRVVGVIRWPWVWIAAPVWLPLAILGLVFGFLALRDRTQ